jgi:hypothetical protein
MILCGGDRATRAEEADRVDVSAAAEEGLRLLREKRETVLGTLTTGHA